MPHSRPDSIRHQSLIAISAMNFRQAAELLRAEILPGLRIDIQPANEQQNRRWPKSSPLDTARRPATAA